MNLKIQTLSITGVILALMVTTSVTAPLAFGQTNQTGTIEEKLKSATEKNAMKATAPGDLVFVLICPPDFTSIDQCQIFVGQPA
jgi:hypothetical protein